MNIVSTRKLPPLKANLHSIKTRVNVGSSTKEEISDTFEIGQPLSRLERAGLGATAGGLLAGSALALLGNVGAGIGTGWGSAAIGLAVIGGAAFGSSTWEPQNTELPFKSVEEIRELPEFQWTVPTRDAQLARLKDPKEEFDVLVIGGGATGAGTALNASLRGLKVAAVEGSDFSAGTSSKSTKLIHGGVRYLEKAVKNLDRGQWDLVKEGLHERRAFLDMAPHLTDEVRLVTPIYDPLQLPYYYAGLALYDLLAGNEALEGTEMLSRQKTKERLAGVKDDGLWGSVAYSDGEFNDARMNVSLATTAAAHGAAIANHTKVIDLVKNDEGMVVGATLQDELTKESWDVKSKVIINATGPFIDGVRKMDTPEKTELVVPVAGTHIFVENLEMEEGLLVPKTPNGSVAFFKPFEGGHLIGTTEEPMALTLEPTTTDEHVNYLIDVANGYLNEESQIDRDDISAVWTGIRPLVKDPKTVDGETASISRKHIMEVSDSGLITIGGGKWTSFGRMAEEVVDLAVKSHQLQALPSQRDSAKLIGSHGYSEGLAAELQGHYDLEQDVAEHLARSYGDRAVKVLDLDKLGSRRRLHPDHPYLEAEVMYSALNEYAVDPVDVLSRRTRMSFIDEEATLASLPRVVELMSSALGWSEATTQQRFKDAQSYYERNGMQALK